MLHSNSRWRLGATLLLGVVGTCFGAHTVSSAAATIPAAASQCHPDEIDLFTCNTGKKVVSLCGAGKPPALAAVSYRYGAPGQVEMEYVAKAGNGHVFHGMTEPLQPNAIVRQVWFDKGDIRYLMTACEGGNCPYEAGLAVRRAGKYVMKARCVLTDPDLASFDPKLVEFGSAQADSLSATPLLLLGEDENHVELLYPRRRDFN
jgi:hypothetical protein